MRRRAVALSHATARGRAGRPRAAPHAHQAVALGDGLAGRGGTESVLRRGGTLATPAPIATLFFFRAASPSSLPPLPGAAQAAPPPRPSTPPLSALLSSARRADAAFHSIHPRCTHPIPPQTSSPTTAVPGCIGLAFYMLSHEEHHEGHKVSREYCDIRSKSFPWGECALFDKKCKAAKAAAGVE